MLTTSRQRGPLLRRISFAAWTLASVSALGAAAGQVPEPCTYRIWLCSEVCTPSDSGRAVAVATIVIFSSGAAADERVQSAFAGLPEIPRTNATNLIDDVCFRVTRRAPRVGNEELFFGIRPKGRTRWRYAADDGFSLLIYLSADAGYSLRWANPGVVARGEGWSYGRAVGTPFHRNAYFAAIRTGEPDVTQCI